MNESLASTTADDSLFLGRKVIGRLIELGALAVYVTFVDELSRLGPSVVSMSARSFPTIPRRELSRWFASRLTAALEEAGEAVSVPTLEAEQRG
jgi:hypothetical protein